MDRIKKSRFIVFVAVLLTLIACEMPADISRPQEYSSNGIGFSLPSNWSVTEEIEGKDFKYLYVDSPGLSSLLVTIYEQEDSFTLREYTDAVVKISVKDFFLGSRNEGRVLKIKKPIAGHIHEGFRNEFVATYVVVRVPHVDEFYRLTTNNKTVFISTHAAVGDLDKVEKGFDLVISTFRLE